MSINIPVAGQANEIYSLRVNGQEHHVKDAWIGESLLYVLRERLGLPGSKGACEQGECGSCTVIVDSKAVNLGTTPKLFGLFSSRHSAKSKLNELAQQHGLCKVVLGLEKTSTRGCFGLQIKTCLGACVGKEDRAQHDERLLTALKDLQVEVWPFSGAVELIEECNGWVQRHRVNNWCHLETWCSKTGQASQVSAFHPQDFDRDSYQILVKPIMLRTVEIQSC
jgi:excinuclease Cho